MTYYFWLGEEAETTVPVEIAGPTQPDVERIETPGIVMEQPNE